MGWLPKWANVLGRFQKQERSEDDTIPPPGTDLLALASISPETAEVLNDEELQRLEKLCHDSVGDEEASSPLRVTAQGIRAEGGSDAG